jgi:hypothetical protein
MTKTILLALLALATATEVSAQSRTFYDSAGRVIGKSSTDSSGTVTNYDSRGRHQPRDDDRQHDDDL